MTALLAKQGQFEEKEEEEEEIPFAYFKGRTTTARPSSCDRGKNG
jgi:hypothetical protein